MNKILISILTGLGGMFGWGTADFLAGSTIAKIGVLKTFFWVQFFGLVVNVLWLIYYIPSSLNFDVRFLSLSFIAAVAYLFGYLLLYRAFSKGELSIVSPIASTYTIFTVLVAIFIYHQSLFRWQLPAIIIIIIGVMLISINFQRLEAGKFSLTAGVREAMGAAILFGLVFWPFNEYITERTNWIFFNVIVKSFALGLFLIYQTMFLKGVKLSFVPRESWKFLVLVGVLDLIGFLSVGYGVSVADSVLVVPISSAFSLVTIFLAMTFLREKITFSQGAGIALTITGIVLAGV